MRKSLIAMLMLLTLTAGNEAMAQKHRHNPNITLNVQDPSTGQNAQVNIQVDDNDSTGIVAYSDTTGVDTAAIDNVPATSNGDDFDFEDELNEVSEYEAEYGESDKEYSSDDREKCLHRKSTGTHGRNYRYEVQ